MTDRELGERLKRESWIAGKSFWYVLLYSPWYFWQIFHVTRPSTESRWFAFKFACVYTAWFLQLSVEASDARLR